MSFVLLYIHDNAESWATEIMFEQGCATKKKMPWVIHDWV